MSSGPQDEPPQGEPPQDQAGQWQPDPQPGWPSPPQPSSYAQPYAGWPQPGRRTNPLAIAALCCAVGQFIAGPFAGIAAIVLAAMSLKQIEVSGEDGRGLAVTGFVLGIVGLLVFVLLLIFAVALVHGVAVSFNSSNN